LTVEGDLRERKGKKVGSGEGALVHLLV
jgi:hypothetical protein